MAMNYSLRLMWTAGRKKRPHVGRFQLRLFPLIRSIADFIDPLIEWIANLRNKKVTIWTYQQGVNPIQEI
jgi:hypothetical protein